MAQKQGRPTNQKAKKYNSTPVKAQDVVKRTEFYCSVCGKQYNKQSGVFPTSRSPLYEGNDGYLNICKTCLEALYLHYVEVLDDEILAIERTCMKIDNYFSLPIAESCLATSAGKSVIMNYISRTALNQYKSKNFDSTLDEYAYIEEQQLINKPPTDEEKIAERIKADAMREWGLSNLSLDDIQFLNDEFADWNARTNVNGKSRENLVRDLCVIRLQCNKALDNGDTESYNRLSSNYQKALQTANLTPKQEEEAERLNELPLGVLLKKIEDEEPIPEPLPEFRDCDKIHSKILSFFIGHLCNMLHIKNRYEQQYKDTLQEYAAVAPEDIASEDEEDIFEYLMNNGFSSVENQEGDQE